jgi:hypothetical protein
MFLDAIGPADSTIAEAGAVYSLTTHFALDAIEQQWSA